MCVYVPLYVYLELLKRFVSVCVCVYVCMSVCVCVCVCVAFMWGEATDPCASPGQWAAPAQPLVLHVAPQHVLRPLQQHRQRHARDVALLWRGHLVAEGELQQCLEAHLGEILPHPDVNLSLCKPHKRGQGMSSQSDTAHNGSNYTSTQKRLIWVWSIPPTMHCSAQP